MQAREDAVKQWFTMWLTGKDSGVENLFSKDAVYMESWGPEYHGVKTISHWFREWNERGSVLQWDILQYFHKENKTVVEWVFVCKMNDGSQHAFDGLSLIEWDAQGKIQKLKEFGCRQDRYNPYQDGKEPKFDGRPVPFN